MEVLELKSDLKNLKMVEQFVENIGDAYEINDSYFGNILLALTEVYYNSYIDQTEAVKNAIIHGNAYDINKKVKIDFFEEKNQISFTVTDEGRGFDYLNLPDPIGDEKAGRGIYLMKSLSDNLEFSNEGKTVNMTFILQGINFNLSKNRIKTLKNYNKQKIKRTSI